jgi:hypothetical protein
MQTVQTNQRCKEIKPLHPTRALLIAVILLGSRAGELGVGPLASGVSVSYA